MYFHPVNQQFFRYFFVIGLYILWNIFEVGVACFVMTSAQTRSTSICVSKYEKVLSMLISWQASRKCGDNRPTLGTTYALLNKLGVGRKFLSLGWVDYKNSKLGKNRSEIFLLFKLHIFGGLCVVNFIHKRHCNTNSLDRALHKKYSQRIETGESYIYCKNSEKSI